ncbi:MAG: DUF2029 domain-containing protein [Rhodospirillales bacterium]|nr:DUF2029 domain-containing protein [Rhodospirillales bacterium]
MNLDLIRQASWLDAARAWRFTVVFAAISLIATAWDFIAHTTHGVMDETGEQLARDFINYWAGARLAIEGRAAMAYDTSAYHAFQRELIGALSEFRMYSYPPTAMLLSLPLAALGFVPALALWTLGGLAWTAALLSRVIGRKLGILAAVAAPAAFVNTISGQNGAFSAGFLCGGLMLLERRPVLAGILFGCLCYKPQIGVLLPVALAAGGYWRTFLATGATALLLVGVSTAWLGLDAWAGLAHQSVMQRGLLELGYTLWHRMPTSFATARALGASVPVAYAVQILSGGLAAAAVAIVWRGGATMPVKASVLVTATFLATPYAWDYDLVATVFVVAWLAGEAARTAFRPWEKIGLAALVAMPLVLGPIAEATRLQIGPIVLWAVLVLATRRALDPAMSLSPRLPASSPGPSGASR